MPRPRLPPIVMRRSAVAVTETRIARLPNADATIVMIPVGVRRHPTLNVRPRRRWHRWRTETVMRPQSKRERAVRR